MDSKQVCLFCVQANAGTYRRGKLGIRSENTEDYKNFVPYKNRKKDRRKKNLERGNLKKKASAILLAAAMTATSFPSLSSEVHAAEPPEITQFATKEELKTFNTDDTDGSENPAKVYFGKDGSGSAQAWWITGSQNGNLTLYAICPLPEEKKQFYEGSWPEDILTYDADWGCTYPNGAPAEVAATHYGASLVRKVLKGMETDTSYFSEAEQALMNKTTIYTSDVFFDRGNPIIKEYYTTDKLYLANGETGNPNLPGYITVGINSASSINGGLRIDSGYFGSEWFWLRTPHSFSPGNVLVVFRGSNGIRPDAGGAIGPYGVMPAFELDLTSVLFASAVPAVTDLVVGKELAAEDVTSKTKPGAFTLRYSADNLGSVQVAHDYTTVELTDVPSDVYLVVQNKNGARARKASGTQSVLASWMGTDSFENCKVWLERTDSTERKTYATMATMAEEKVYSVNLAGNATLKITSGNAAQTVGAGSAIADITVEAAAGYYLPEGYIDGVTLPAGFSAGQEGKTVTISGTPQSDVTITLPNAAEKANGPDTPDVTGGIGVITGTDGRMEYASSADSAVWESCTDGSTKAGAGTWYVRYKETDTHKAGTAREVTVTEPVSMISVDPDSLTFDTKNEGYSDVSAKKVKIQNTGNREIANINAVLTGTNAAAFTLDVSEMQATLAPMAETTVSVKPNKGLAPGVYQAEIKILGNSDAKKSIPIAFTVEERELPPEHEHNYGIWWKSDSESHWHECPCGDKTDIEAHRFIWIIDQDATADEAGSKHEECEDCGYKGETVEISATGTSESGYKVLEGENQTYSGSGGLTIRANGDFSKFTGIKVDGVEVDASNYDAKSGSTIVTLKESYLSSLSAGDHTMTFVYDDGEVSADFAIAGANTSENPETPDGPANNNSNAGNSNTGNSSAGNSNTGNSSAGNSNSGSGTNSGTNGSVADNSLSPKTGDEADVSRYLLQLVMSGLVIAFCAKWRRRKAY